jgi:thioredoxin reductase (NADPH)
VTEILGETGVTHVRLKSIDTGAESELAADGVFVCIGLVPNTELVAGLVPLDATGRIRVDTGLRTPLPGLSAAGNVRQGSSNRAAGAMGDGVTAAVAVDEYLATGGWINA